MSVVSRSYFSYSVVLANYSEVNAIGANIRAVSGVNWTVDRVEADGSLANPRPAIYGDRTGSTPPNNYDDTPGIEQGITDPNGLIEFWAPPGEYRINISDPSQRLADKEITWNSVPAWQGGLPGEFIEEESLQGNQIEDGQIDTSDLATGAVTTAKIDSGQVTFAKLNADVSELIPPVGTIMDYSGNGDPVAARWVLCDGRQLSQSTYSSLYAVVGAEYNQGNESSGNFRIPDFRGRVSVGQENMGTPEGAPATARNSSSNSLGDVGGASGVTLTSGQMPQITFTPSGSVSVTGSISQGGSHSHNAQGDGAFVVQTTAGNFAGFFSAGITNTDGGGYRYANTNPGGQHSHDWTATSTGFTGTQMSIGNASPSVVENRQPYLVVNKIIRIK